MKIFFILFYTISIMFVQCTQSEEERTKKLEKIQKNIQILKEVTQKKYYDIPNPFKHITGAAHTIGELSEKYIVELEVDENLDIHNKADTEKGKESEEEKVVQYKFTSKDRDKQKKDIEKQIQKTQEAQQRLQELQGELQAAEENQKGSIERNIKDLQIKYGLDPAETIEKLQQRVKNFSPLHFLYEFDNSEKGDFNKNYTKMPNEKLKFKLFERPNTISKVNFYQNELKKYMKKFGFIHGPLLEENEIKYEEDGKQYDLQMQGNFVPITEALHPVLNSVSSDKHVILQNIMIMSIVFKKVLVMMKTLSGMQSYQCPDAQNKEKTNQLNEFIQKVDKFDYFAKKLVQKEINEYKSNTIESVKQIKQDLNQGIITEHYNPNFELNNIVGDKSTHKDPNEHYSYYNPLGHLTNFMIDFGHAPSDQCQPEVFKGNPIIIPFLNSDMLGFSEETFELVYYYDKVIKKIVPDSVTGQLKLGDQEYEDYTYSDVQNSKEFMKQVIDLVNKQTNVQTRSFQSVLDKTEEIAKNIDIVIKRIQWQRKYNDQDEFPDYIPDPNEENIYQQIEKTMIMIKIQQKTIPKVYTEKLTIQQVVYYLSDPQNLFQDIVNNYMDKKQKYYKEMLETLPEEERSKIKITQEYDIEKIKALYKFNINRMMAFLYQNLKFTPFVHPESFLLLKNLGYENQIQETYDKIFEQIKNEDTEQEKLNKIEQIIKNDEILKAQDASEILNTAQIVEKLTNNKNYKYNSKVHLTLKSFADFINVFMREQVSKDVSIKQCFTPLHLMNRGSECPIFIKDLKRFIGSHNEIKINFESIYGLFLYYFDTNPNELTLSMDNFIDYMFAFARLQKQKFMQTNNYFNLDELTQKRVVEMYNFPHQKTSFENDFQKQSFKNFVHAITLEDLGEIYPEYQNLSEDYLMDQVDPNVPISHDQGSNDKDFTQMIDRGSKLEKLYTQLEQLKESIDKILHTRII